MDKDKNYKPFNEDEAQQLSFLYTILESQPKKAYSEKDSTVFSKLHQTNNYPLFEHHKPISKIIDYTFLKHDKE